MKRLREGPLLPELAAEDGLEEVAYGDGGRPVDFECLARGVDPQFRAPGRGEEHRAGFVGGVVCPDGEGFVGVGVVCDLGAETAHDGLDGAFGCGPGGVAWGWVAVVPALGEARGDPLDDIAEGEV